MMRNHVATLARRGAMSPSGPGSLDIGDGLAARRVGTGVSKTLRGAPTETWVVHPYGDPGAPVLQAEIYKQGLGWTAWTGSLTRATDRKLAQRVAHARNAGHTTVAERRSDHGGGYGGMVMSPASDRRRWDELHAAHVVARTAVDDYERQLGPKYGWSQSWRSWITKTERDKLERLEAKKHKIGDKIVELLVRVSPRGEAWLSGVPVWWIQERLTWEDAVRPVDEPLSVEVPLSWGNTRRLTEESHGEACTCAAGPQLEEGQKYLPASAIEIEPNGRYGVWVDREHYRRYDAKLWRGKWILTGNWQPDYVPRRTEPVKRPGDTVHVNGELLVFKRVVDDRAEMVSRTRQTRQYISLSTLATAPLATDAEVRADIGW